MRECNDTKEGIGGGDVANKDTVQIVHEGPSTSCKVCRMYCSLTGEPPQMEETSRQTTVVSRYVVTALTTSQREALLGRGDCTGIADDEAAADVEM